MPSDPTKPLLKLVPNEPQARRQGRPAFPARPEAFPPERQQRRFGPIFNRLAEVLGRDPTGLELRADPTALAPERLLVFEVRGPIATFADAINRVQGLELVDEDEIKGDEHDTNPVAYLMVPDARALREIQRLWERWRGGQTLGRGYASWREVFALLRDLRPWGPQDRVQPLDADILAEEVAAHDDDTALITLEIELVYRPTTAEAIAAEGVIARFIAERGGSQISRARIPEIAYHAVLADMPVAAVRSIVARNLNSIAGLEPVMYIRPQSVATSIEVDEVVGAGAMDGLRPNGEPILALLDGVPIARHPLMLHHLQVEDLFELEAETTVADRKHGSAMASLIIHGDRNSPETSLPRRIHVIPVLGAGEAFPQRRLIVDLIYQAVLKIRGGEDPSAPNALIFNLSLGNQRRPFHGQMSPWARLLDRLAHRYGILFIASAGNVTPEFPVPPYSNRLGFEDAAAADRARAVVGAVGNIAADRRLFAPAETINGLTVGASNQDAVSEQERRLARLNVDPFGNILMPNPSSALGPGFAGAVKPEILMPGARERLIVVGGEEHILVRPSGPSRAAGLKVAAPPFDGVEAAEGYTNGTSAAAALASRTAHRIHDALEGAYGDDFLRLPHAHRAALLKALLIHPAAWPEGSAVLIKEVLGPADGRQHVRQKDNIRRFLGYGVVNADDAVACAEDRATFWATGSLSRERSVIVAAPIPAAYGGKAQLHSISATLAWFTPVFPGRKTYRTVRLKLLEPEGLSDLNVSAHSYQPDSNQSNRGTVSTRCWSGNGAAAVDANMNLNFVVQREPDSGAVVDEPVPFGLAISISMPGIVEIYEQARQRLGIAPRIGAP